MPVACRLFVMGLADDVEFALQGGPVGGMSSAFSDEELPDGGTNCPSVAPNRGEVDWHVPPPEEGQAFVGHDFFDMGHTSGQRNRILGQEDHAHAVLALSGQCDPDFCGGLAEKGIWHLHQDARSISGVRVGARGSPVPQVVQHFQRFGDYCVGSFHP